MKSPEPKNRQENLQKELYGAFVPQSGLNTIRFASNETLLHVICKAILAHKIAQKANFLTEAYFDGGELDVYDLSSRYGYELVTTSNPPRFNLPEKISDCIVIKVDDKVDWTLKDLAKSIYSLAGMD